MTDTARVAGDGVPSVEDAPRVRRWAVPVASAAWIATIVIVVIGLAMWARADFPPPAYVFMPGPLPLLVFAAAVVLQVSSGLIVAVRRPENVVGWLVIAFALASSSAVLAIGYVARATVDGSAPIEPTAVAWVTSWGLFGTACFLATTLAFVFPDGRFLSPTWRNALSIPIIGWLLTSMSLAGWPGPMLLFRDYANPVVSAGPDAQPPMAALVVGMATLALGAALGGLSLVVRYRTADPTTRLQIRWYAFAGVLLVIAFMVFLVALATLEPRSPVGELVQLVFLVAVCLPPIALVIAITRYRLYDIDTIIGRTFVYGLLTAILAGLYTASVRLFNVLFEDIVGEASEIELVVTTLILATSFFPIKRRLEGVAERRLASHPFEVAAAGAAEATTAQAPTEPDASLPTAVDSSAILSDPAFTAALDERIRAVLAAERALDPPGAGEHPGRSS